VFAHWIPTLVPAGVLLFIMRQPDKPKTLVLGGEEEDGEDEESKKKNLIKEPLLHYNYQYPTMNKQYNNITNDVSVQSTSTLSHIDSNLVHMDNSLSNHHTVQHLIQPTTRGNRDSDPIPIQGQESNFAPNDPSHLPLPNHSLTLHQQQQESSESSVIL